MSGIVYMVQPAELVGSNKYKIGCSSKNDLSRCKTYKIGTRYIHIMECTDPLIVEKEIIRVFKEKFKLVCGREYFEGNETDMDEEFYKIVKNRNKLYKISNQSKTNINSIPESELNPTTKIGISNAIDNPVIKINAIGKETFDHLTEKDIISVLSFGRRTFTQLASMMYDNPENQNLCFHIKNDGLVKYVNSDGCLIINNIVKVANKVISNIESQLATYIANYSMFIDNEHDFIYMNSLLSDIKGKHEQGANVTSHFKKLYFVLCDVSSTNENMVSKYENQLNLTGTLCDCPDKKCAANHPVKANLESSS
jgi:hypothetical protein